VPSSALMKNKLVPLLGIAFVVALIATGIFYGLFVGKMRNSNPRYSLVAASHEIARGAVLQAGDLKVETIEAPEPPKGTYTTIDHVVGLTVLDPLKEGSPIVDTHLASHRSVPVGMRAISIHVTDSNGVVSMLQPGYKVDVQVVTQSSKNEPSLRTVLQNIEVLTTSPVENGRPVVNLIVTPPDADVLGLADATARIRLTLRNPLDQNQPALGVIPASALLQHTQGGSATAPATPAGPRTAADRLQKVAVPR